MKMFILFALLLSMCVGRSLHAQESQTYVCDSLAWEGRTLLGVHHEVSLQGDLVELETRVLSPGAPTVRTPLRVTGPSSGAEVAYDSSHLRVILSHGVDGGLESVRLETLSEPSYQADCRLKTEE